MTALIVLSMVLVAIGFWNQWIKRSAASREIEKQQKMKRLAQMAMERELRNAKRINWRDYE